MRKAISGEPGRLMRNKASREERLALNAISFFLGLPLGAVLLIVRYGPAAEPELPQWLSFELPLSLVFMILCFLAYRLVFMAEGVFRFVVALVVTECLFVIASIVFGVLIHRDFFTAAFQYILGALVAVLCRVAHSPKSSLRKNVQRSLGRASLVVAVFYIEWIMLMGYAISTRAEPRPVESIIYNVYNLAQVLALFILSRMVERRSFQTVIVGKDELSVDGRDIVSVLGQKKATIFRGLASAADRRLRCPDVQRLFREDADEADSRCLACSESTTKAALCGKYRNTYNSVLELKRVLEFLEIGTIATSENKRHILSEGWTLALFENTRIELRKK
jgi:hypothetical protein